MSGPDPVRPHTAFAGNRMIASGPFREVALAVRKWIDTQASPAASAFLVFDDETGRVVDTDLSGSEQDLLARLASSRAPEGAGSADATRRRPGRPRLGVVSREVTLLPRHWAWLRVQRGGASATLRRLVDQARKREAGADHVRRSQDATYRFMTAVLGDAPGYEEALRALYAGDGHRFERESEPWPWDLRRYALHLASTAFTAEAGGAPGAALGPDAAHGRSGPTE